MKTEGGVKMSRFGALGFASYPQYSSENSDVTE